MKLIQADGEQYVFRLGKRDRDLFAGVLRHYPLIPVNHHRLSRSGVQAADPADQVLLEEAMASEKSEGRKRVDRLLNSPQRWATDRAAFRLTLTREEMEWLLQVLNDIRVGSWLKLGCPDPDEGKPPQVAKESTPYLLILELAGHFECALLSAL